MTSVVIEDATPRRRSGMIAPLWHMVAVITFYLALAVIGPTSMRAHSEMPHASLYVYAGMMTWMQLSMAVAGVYRRHEFFVETLRANARSWWLECMRGISIYLLVSVLFVLIYLLLRRVHLHPNFDNTAATAMRPLTLIELLQWLLVSLCIGFCEEHVFRGYLLQQTIGCIRSTGISWTTSAGLAVIFTSALFGVLHLYEGIGGAVTVGCLGVIYCIAALRFGNLRAVIVAHALQDFAGSALSFMHHSQSVR